MPDSLWFIRAAFGAAFGAAPVFWLFFFLTGMSLFVFRHWEPHASRPYRVPLYPVTPLLFCGVCIYMLFSSLAYTGKGALVGVPGGVCANCAVPVACGVTRGHGRVEVALGRGQQALPAQQVLATPVPARRAGPASHRRPDRCAPSPAADGGSEGKATGRRRPW